MSDTPFIPFLRPSVIAQVCLHLPHVGSVYIWGRMKRGIIPSLTLCVIHQQNGFFLQTHYAFKYHSASKRSVLGYQCILWGTITLESRISYKEKVFENYKIFLTFIFLILEDFSNKTEVPVLKKIKWSKPYSWLHQVSWFSTHVRLNSNVFLGYFFFLKPKEEEEQGPTLLQLWLQWRKNIPKLDLNSRSSALPSPCTCTLGFTAWAQKYCSKMIGISRAS